MKLQTLTLATSAALLMFGCSSDDGGDGADNGNSGGGIFKAISDTEAEVNGEIKDGAHTQFAAFMQANPGITKLILMNVPGADVGGITVDGRETDAALELGREVYKRGIATHIPANGLVASGGTDLFASGAKTSYAGELGGFDDCEQDVRDKTCIGVHSWGGGGATGWDLKDDKDHAEHDKYKAFYKAIGVDEAFYFYTLGAAKADAMAYMSEADFAKYLKR